MINNIFNKLILIISMDPFIHIELSDDVKQIKEKAFIYATLFEKNYKTNLDIILKKVEILQSSKYPNTRYIKKN